MLFLGVHTSNVASSAKASHSDDRRNPSVRKAHVHSNSSYRPKATITLTMMQAMDHIPSADYRSYRSPLRTNDHAKSRRPANTNAPLDAPRCPTSEPGPPVLHPSRSHDTTTRPNLRPRPMIQRKDKTNNHQTPHPTSHPILFKKKSNNNTPTLAPSTSPSPSSSLTPSQSHPPHHPIPLAVHIPRIDPLPPPLQHIHPIQNPPHPRLLTRHHPPPPRPHRPKRTPLPPHSHGPSFPFPAATEGSRSRRVLDLDQRRRRDGVGRSREAAGGGQR